jgi:hypothetical protein
VYSSSYLVGLKPISLLSINLIYNYSRTKIIVHQEKIEITKTNVFVPQEEK